MQQSRALHPHTIQGKRERAGFQNLLQKSYSDFITAASGQCLLTPLWTKLGDTSIPGPISVARKMLRVDQSCGKEDGVVLIGLYQSQTIPRRPLGCTQTRGGTNVGELISDGRFH